MLESAYQADLIARLELELPGCVVLKNDSSYRQGVPDLLVLYKKRWAMLEVKKSARAAEQPNQRWWVDYFGSMSYAAFIYPENEGEVLNDLRQALGARRPARIPQP